MKIDPFADQPNSSSGANIAAQKISAKIEHRFFTLVLSMKVRRIVIVEKHLDHYAEKK